MSRQNSLTTNRQMALMDKFRKEGIIDPYKLTCFIYGGPDIVEARRAAWARFESKVNCSDIDKLPRCYGDQTRQDMFDEGLERGKAAFEDCRDHGHDFFLHHSPNYQLNSTSPFGPHSLIVLPALKLLATEQQFQKWLVPALRGEWTGAYGQTELGHGSGVKQLETTATYVPGTDEFEINSPTISSAKWWPGGMGYSCTHVLVAAQLMVKSQNYGLHMFIVPLRDPDDGFKLFPGIETGDIGLKMTFNGVDNGFAIFDHVRIPRENLLMKYTKVLPGGQVISCSKDDRSFYSAMVQSRHMVAYTVAMGCAMATTIASRYSVVREQGLGPNGGLPHEVSVLEYKSQRYRICCLIARSYAILLASNASRNFHAAHANRVKDGDHSLGQYSHVLAAGIKAWSTILASEGTEDARKLCGGHGFLAMSGIPDIVAAVTVCCTLEGDNYVLWQQVFRFLFKTLGSIKNKSCSVVSDLSYLEDGYEKFSKDPFQPLPSYSGRQLLQLTCHLEIYKHRALTMVFSTAALLDEDKAEGIPDGISWNTHMLDIIAAARAHTEYLVISSIFSQLSHLPFEYRSIKPMLCRLIILFALSTIHDPLTPRPGFTELLSRPQVRDINRLVDQLVQSLTPNIIALTDAWDFTDATLCSALGCKDGNAYERMLSWARQLPINVESRPDEKEKETQQAEPSKGQERKMANERVYRRGLKWIEGLIRGGRLAAVNKRQMIPPELIGEIATKSDEVREPGYAGKVPVDLEFRQKL